MEKIRLKTMDITQHSTIKINFTAHNHTQDAPNRVSTLLATVEVIK
jgi:hypothetical protein